MPAWDRIAITKDGTSVELYYRTVEERGLRKAWVRYTQRVSKDLVKRTVAYEAFDCNAGRSMTITSTEYRNGQFVSSTPAVADDAIPHFLQPIIPESVGDDVKSVVCFVYLSETR